MTELATPISPQLFQELYDCYGNDLRSAREFISDTVSGNKPQMRCQFDDLEAEAMYLLLRQHQPDVAVEISPCDGWSSLWILRALADNQQGHLLSLDIHDGATKHVPDEAKANWTFIEGDAKETIQQVPDDIDFLLLDSRHTMGFAKWYFENVIPKVRVGSPVIIHDIAGSPRLPFTEAAYVRRKLQKRNIGFFTLNAASADGFAASRLARLYRGLAGVSGQFLETERNPAVFFEAAV